MNWQDRRLNLDLPQNILHHFVLYPPLDSFLLAWYHFDMLIFAKKTKEAYQKKSHYQCNGIVIVCKYLKLNLALGKQLAESMAQLPPFHVAYPVAFLVTG